MTDLPAAATLDLWQAAETRPGRAVARACGLDRRRAGGRARPAAARPPRRAAARVARSLAGACSRRLACPACGEQVEFAIDAVELLARDEAGAGADRGGRAQHPWRLPDSGDVAAAAATGDHAAAERLLLSRCVLDATGADGAVEATSLPAEARWALADAMAQADPLAEVLADVACPACGTAFVADLDLGSFVWTEVRARAQSLLRQVDALARAYGWTEPEVLALDERRRGAYLELVGGADERFPEPGRRPRGGPDGDCPAEAAGALRGTRRGSGQPRGRRRGDGRHSAGSRARRNAHAVGAVRVVEPQAARPASRRRLWRRAQRPRCARRRRYAPTHNRGGGEPFSPEHPSAEAPFATAARQPHPAPRRLATGRRWSHRSALRRCPWRRRRRPRRSRLRQSLPARPPEPPAVRVHIGRLEVRANLTEAPEQPTGQRPAPTAGAGARRLPPRQAGGGMSSPLAIGAVSAVLRNLLDNGFIDVGAPLSPVKVTAVAPDLIKLDDPDTPPSLNLFLYRTSRNIGWAEVGLPWFDSNGSRLSNPPLALNLHYLLTAYGVADFQAEILLGYAMHVLHERPVLDRAAIRRALTRARSGHDPAARLPGAHRVGPRRSARRGHDHRRVARHRGDVAALVGDPGSLSADRVVRRLGGADRGARADPQGAAGALARARRPCDRQGRRVVVVPSLLPPFPTIESVDPPAAQPAVRLGETVRVPATTSTAPPRSCASPTACSTTRTSRDRGERRPSGIDVVLPAASRPSRTGRPVSTR